MTSTACCRRGMTLFSDSCLLPRLRDSRRKSRSSFARLPGFDALGLISQSGVSAS